MKLRCQRQRGLRKSHQYLQECQQGYTHLYRGQSDISLNAKTKSRSVHPLAAPYNVPNDQFLNEKILFLISSYKTAPPSN